MDVSLIHLIASMDAYESYQLFSWACETEMVCVVSGEMGGGGKGAGRGVWAGRFITAYFRSGTTPCKNTFIFLSNINQRIIQLVLMGMLGGCIYRASLIPGDTMTTVIESNTNDAQHE